MVLNMPLATKINSKIDLESISQEFSLLSLLFPSYRVLNKFFYSAASLSEYSISIYAKNIWITDKL